LFLIKKMNGMSKQLNPLKIFNSPAARPQKNNLDIHLAQDIYFLDSGRGRFAPLPGMTGLRH